jgi:hypothetical protein
MREEFRALAHDLSAVLGDECSAAIGDEAALTVRLEFMSTQFVLLHEHDDPDVLTIYSCHGKLEEDCAAALPVRLLETNLALAEAGVGSICLDPRTREIIVVLKLALGGLRSQSLLEVLERASGIARAWRRGAADLDDTFRLTAAAAWAGTRA